MTENLTVAFLLGAAAGSALTALVIVASMLLGAARVTARREHVLQERARTHR